MKKIDLTGGKIGPQLQQILAQAPAAGFSTDDALKAFALQGKLKAAVEAAAETLLLEDAEHQFVLGLVNQQRWLVANAELAEFIGRVRNAAEINVEEMKAR